ncbi:MAG: hypothetical protein MOGMAGMI_01999 [Candidatus Omnitrophica bacterium]|nr:hypothetical protein [Candidatus Omnitrophota bacterium]
MSETAEQYYADRDDFVRYIIEKVNPARKDAGLNEIDRTTAETCFRILYDFQSKDAVRPSVMRVAREMEAVLKENDHKGGWQNCPMEYLRDRLHQEVRELDRALLDGDPKNITKECIDVANFAMMLRDNCGA